MNATSNDKSRHNAVLCPCGKPRTGWIGRVPTCDDCMVKDRLGKHGLRKWNAFHLQQRLEAGEVVNLSDVEIEHVLRYQEDGE